MEVLFKDLYDSEINVSLSWFWDTGFTVKIGDYMNGFVAEFNTYNVHEIEPWVVDKVKELYPDSWYVKSRE